MLLKKNESLVLNEYHVINLCCDLNDKMKDFFKKVKESDKNVFGKLMHEIRNCCSKLMFDHNPDKFN